MAKEQTTFDEQQEPSLEEILKTIKGVISGEGEDDMVETSKDEPLELTEVVEEDGTISNQGMSEMAQDILDSIDSAIDGEDEEVEKQEKAVDKKSEEVADKKSEEVADKESEKAADKESEKAADKESEKAADEKSEKAADEKSEKAADDATEEVIEKPVAEAQSKPEPVKEESVKDNGNKNSLLSNQSAEKSSKALEALVSSVPKRIRKSPGFREGITLEDIVIESLKPYLAEWLDDNLPQIVKELVEKEIKRLVPKDDE